MHNEFWELGMNMITEEENNNPYHFHQKKVRCIVYNCLIVQYVLKFLSTKKKQIEKDGIFVYICTLNIQKYSNPNHSKVLDDST